MKNVSGVLVKPTLASGVRVNGNIFLKSIAYTGAVYVRLLVEDDPDEVDSGIQRSMCYNMHVITINDQLDLND